MGWLEKHGQDVFPATEQRNYREVLLNFLSREGDLNP